MFTLAQFDLAAHSGDSVPSLPAAPVWEVWLFERPWAPAGLLVAAALVVLWMFNQRSQARRGLMWAGVAFLLAVGLVVLATVVTTTREAVAARTRELIGATARAETDRLGELLAPDAVLTAGGVSWLVGRDQIIEGVRQTTGDKYRVKKAAMLEEQQQASGRDFATTQVWVRIEGADAAMFGRCWWRIGWRREQPGGGGDGRWHAESIDIVQVDFWPDVKSLPGEAKILKKD